MGPKKRKRARDRGVISHVLRRAGLFPAVITASTVAVSVAVAAYLVLYVLLPHGDEKIQPKDLAQFALTIAAGVGGVVALVVAYRHQRGAEQSRFLERFGAAAGQLGHADVAVRLAGVYAMAGVADESASVERQQCIDVLCSYLRLPYSPELGANHEVEVQTKALSPGREESTHRFVYRQNDKEVRQTIVRVVAAHLQKDARETWSGCDFDFRGAVLEDADFRGARFLGDLALFDRAVFSGGMTRFDAAGDGAFSFEDGAVFDALLTSFTGAEFSADETSFQGAKFNGEQTIFAGANFLSTTLTSFGWAKFNGWSTSFLGAFFTGDAGVSFMGTSFNGAWTRFDEAVFKGEGTFFDDAVFNRAGVSFDRAHFLADRLTSFKGAEFGGESPVPARRDGKFEGHGTSFHRSEFGNGVVSFEDPDQWDPAPQFDWDEDLRLKPENVLPGAWPPKVIVQK